MLSMVPVCPPPLPYTLNSQVSGSLISAFVVFTRMMPLLVSALETGNGTLGVLLLMVWACNAPFSSTSTLIFALAVTVPVARLDTTPLKCRSGKVADPIRSTSGVTLPERGVNTRLFPSTFICQNESSQVGLYKPFGFGTVMVGVMLVLDRRMVRNCSVTV